MDFVVSPSIVTPAAQSGGQTPQFTLGQVVEATVLSVLKDGAVRILIADTVLDVRSEIPLEPGTTLRFAVKGGADGIRLVTVPGSIRPPHANGAAGPAAAPPSKGPATAGSGAPVSRTIEGGPNGAAAPPTVDLTTDRSAAASPAEALAGAVRLAATRQAGLAPLFANLERLASLTAEFQRSAPSARNLTPANTALSVPPNAPPSTFPPSTPNTFSNSPNTPPRTAPSDDAVLRESVRQVAVRLLGQRVLLDGDITAQDLKAAFARSGLFMEQRLAAGHSDGKDIKILLTALRQAARSWVDASAPAPAPADGAASSQSMLAPSRPPTAQGRPLLPPYRGAPMVAQPAMAPAISEDMTLREIGQHLLEQTEAALSRQTLLQAASLPDSRPDRAQAEMPSARWLFEVPLASPQGTSIGQFEISRDGRGPEHADITPVWRARFSIDIEPVGPVHAQIALVGTRAAVTLWAERTEVAEALRARARQLADALVQADLEPGDIQVRAGGPRSPQPDRPMPGRFLDKAS